MASKHKCAVIATGGRGKDHISWLRANKRLELVALCDINKELVEKQAEQYKTKAYTDYRELIEKEKLDMVFIASPHYMHAPMTILAAENDINVFCEKPMAINLKQCDDMIIAARKNAVKLAIGLQLRHDPVYKYLKEAVAGKKGDLGDLGRITDITMIARHYRGEAYYTGSAPVDPNTGVTKGHWRGRWETEGAGILINQAIHNIDILRYVSGPFRKLAAFGKTIAFDHKFIEVEDTVSAAFEMENGGVGNIILSSSNHKSEDNRLVIHGTDGYISTGGGYAGNFVQMDTRYKDEEDYEIDFAKKDQVDDFIDSVENDHEPFVPGEEGRKSIEIVRAILKSLAVEGPVGFPFQDTMSFPIVHNINRDKPLEW